MFAESRLFRSVAGGFVGTAVMTMMMYVVAPMMGLEMDIAAMLGSMVGAGFGVGMLLHIVNGAVIFPAIYTYLLFDLLPGPSVVRGIVWGLVLWLVAQTMVMPMMGAGLFSSQAGGIMAVMGSLMGHAMYGALLGAIAGGSHPAAAESPGGAPAAHAASA